MSDRIDVGTMAMPRHRRRYRLTLSRSLQIFSSFLIPLLLSIFTIVIAIYQQKIGNDNRQMDIKIDKEQRDEDQRIDENQRNIDYNTSLQQRLEEKQKRENQREQDKYNANLESEIDINLTEYQLNQETNLDEQHRLINQQERNTNLELAQNRKQEQILQKFVHDISILIGNSTNKISSDILFTIRWKTFVAIRQLDSQRKTLIFNNLYEIGLLDTFYQEYITIPLNLAEGDFDGIDFSSEPIEENRSISFRGMSLINSIFDNNNIQGSDFSFTKLIGSSFKNSILNRSIFNSADLTNSSFTNANIKDSDFTNAILIDSDITIEQLNSVTFLDGAILPNKKQFENSNLLWINNYQKTKFLNVWDINKDNHTDYQFDLEENDEWAFKVKAQYRLSLKSHFKRRIPNIYDKWIKQNNNVKMRIKTQCGTYGQNTTLSYFIYHYHLDQNLPFANFSFGPIMGNMTDQSIDLIPISLDLKYDLEFIFERSKPTESVEYIGYCQNIHLSFVMKHF